MKSPVFGARMNLAQKTWPDEFEMAYSDAVSSPSMRVGKHGEKKDGKSMVGQGV
jgi:hypothetical protein